MAQGRILAAVFGAGAATCGGAKLRSRFGDPFQFQSDVARGLETVTGIFRQARIHDVLERGRSKRLDHRDRFRIFFENRVGHADLALAVKRAFSGCHFVEDRAQKDRIARPRACLQFAPATCTGSCRSPDRRWSAAR